MYDFSSPYSCLSFLQYFYICFIVLLFIVLLCEALEKRCTQSYYYFDKDDDDDDDDDDDNNIHHHLKQRLEPVQGTELKTGKERHFSRNRIRTVKKMNMGTG